MHQLTKDELAAYTNSYIEINEGEYFCTPQIFSPLYCNFYSALLSDQQPSLPKGVILESYDRTLKECNNPFDRYLSAYFGSKYELSHPLALNKEDCNIEKLLCYLQTRYGKASNDQYSFNYDRDKKQLLKLFPEPLREYFGTDKFDICRSSWYKLFTINYKLSKLNTQWKQLVYRSELSLGDIRESSKSQKKLRNKFLDNIVGFNDTDNLKSRANSALFMTLFYELDQGRPDGPANFSKLAIMTPIALEAVEEWIELKAIGLWNDYLSIEDIKSKVTKFFLEGNERCESYFYSKCVDRYEDINHEFYDYLLVSVLKNDFHNKLVSKFSLEYSWFNNSQLIEAIDTILNGSNWVKNEVNNSERVKLVSEALKIDNKKIDSEIFTVSNVINFILLKHKRTINKPFVDNLSLLLAVAIKYVFPTHIEGATSGANKQEYNFYKSLIDGSNKFIDVEKSLWNLNRTFRPSLIHFLVVLHDLVHLWDNKTVDSIDKFFKIREIVFEKLFEFSEELKDKHHYYILLLGNFLQCGGLNISEIDYRFWAKQNEEYPLIKNIIQHSGRVNLRWP